MYALLEYAKIIRHASSRWLYKVYYIIRAPLIYHKSDISRMNALALLILFFTAEVIVSCKSRPGFIEDVLFDGEKSLENGKTCIKSDDCADDEKCVDGKCRSREDICKSSILDYDVNISDSEQLRQISEELSAPGCTIIGGDLSVEIADIENVDGLENLKDIKGNLLISGNEKLTNIDGIGNLESVGKDITIVRNSSLIDINGLGRLKKMSGDLKIINNKSLINVEGLRNIEGAAKGIYVERNNSLKDIDALSKILELEGDLTIMGNDSLLRIKGLENIEAVEGGLTIDNNSIVEDLLGLKRTARVGGSLVIQNLATVNSLKGLEALTRIGDGAIGGSLIINNVKRIEDLVGLNSLVKVGGKLTIESNISLISLNGAEALNTIDGDISITNNTALENCQAVRFVGRLTDLPEDIKIEIKDNMESKCDVKSECCDGCSDINEGVVCSLNLSEKRNGLCVKGYCEDLLCGERECGDDGHGGSCGTCPLGKECVSGVCEDYAFNCDGEVCIQSKLMWQRQAGEFTSNEYADATCSDLILGGSSDWRLPEIDELKLLYLKCPEDKRCGEVSTCGWYKDLEGECSGYWSSTDYDINDYHYVYDFGSGETSQYPYTWKAYYRCVRDVD
jgi:hypothetical protein